MSIKTVTYITTADGKTYAFPPEEGVENPQLWEVELRIRCVSDQRIFGSATWSTGKSVYLERKHLEQHNLLAAPFSRKEEPKIERTKTAEDLLIELLGTLGYYPQE